jgi:cold shock CspA family protein
MQFDGRLSRWNDDRGFGFIAPTTGHDDIFVHISAFPRQGPRPTLNERLLFEIEPGPDGRKRAVRVRRPGRQPAGRRSPHRHRPLPQRPRRRSNRWTIGAVLVAAALAGAGGIQQWAPWTGPVGETADPPATATARRPSAPAAPQWRCDGRQHCSQMTSCAEAKFFIRNCPNTKMDGDGDGIPCERQWCGGPW